MNKIDSGQAVTGINSEFCLPMFSIIFQQLYNIADSLVATASSSARTRTVRWSNYEMLQSPHRLAFGCNIGCSVITCPATSAQRNTVR